MNIRVEAAPRVDVTPRDATLVWLAAWFIGQSVGAIVVTASGRSDLNTAGPGWLAAVAIAGWLPLLAAMVLLARRSGVTSPLMAPRSFGLSFRPIDLAGIPLGIAVQVGVLPLLYWPLRSIWPHTFDDVKVQQRARDLWQHAHGIGVLVLIVVVVVGAPLVEELVYRGLLQGAIARRRGAGVLLVALWFAAVHFQPIETPGLFVVGLVLGGATWFTRRLGMGVLAHMAFNATGLVMVAVVR